MVELEKLLKVKQRFSVLPILIAAILLGLVLFGCTQSGNIATDASQTQTQGDLNSNLATYTTGDVALHSTSADCWIILNGMVYDVTQKTVSSEDQFGAQLKDSCGKELTLSDSKPQQPSGESPDMNAGPRPDFNGQPPSNMPAGDFNSGRDPKSSSPQGMGQNGLNQYLIGKLAE